MTKNTMNSKRCSEKLVKYTVTDSASHLYNTLSRVTIIRKNNKI